MPASGMHVAERVSVYEQLRGNGRPNPRCEALCWGLCGTGVMMAVLWALPWDTSQHQILFMPSTF